MQANEFLYRQILKTYFHISISRKQDRTALHKTLIPAFQTIMVFSFEKAISFSSNQDTKIEIDKCIILGPIKQPIEYSLPAQNLKKCLVSILT